MENSISNLHFSLKESQETLLQEIKAMHERLTSFLINGIPDLKLFISDEMANYRTDAVINEPPIPKEDLLKQHLPEKFDSWREPYFSFAKHYFFLKSRYGADSMISYFQEKYPGSKVAISIRNYFSSLRNDWKRRLSLAATVNK